MKRTILITLILACTGVKVRAQADPTLAGMVAVYTEKTKKTLKTQEKVVLLQTTGHVWIKEEVVAVTDLQREFSDYLDSFRSVVSYAAQIYGFYHEITRLAENMGDLTHRIGNAGNILGNFLGNLAGGRVSGMSIAGLIAGAFLVFGRTG